MKISMFLAFFPRYFILCTVTSEKYGGGVYVVYDKYCRKHVIAYLLVKHCHSGVVRRLSKQNHSW